MRELSVAATVALAALYSSSALAVDGNKQLGKVHFETFCTQKVADPKCAIIALSVFAYPHVPPPVANLPLGLDLILKPRQRPIYEYTP
jgi:hypothetical protein